MYSVKSVSEEI